MSFCFNSILYSIFGIFFQGQQTQRELLEQFNQRSSSLEEVTEKADDLEGRLKQEAEAKEFLALELNKAEGKL